MWHKTHRTQIDPPSDSLAMSMRCRLTNRRPVSLVELLVINLRPLPSSVARPPGHPRSVTSFLGVSTSAVDHNSPLLMPRYSSVFLRRGYGRRLAQCFHLHFIKQPRQAVYLSINGAAYLFQ